MNKWKLILPGAAIIFVALQLFNPARTNPPVKLDFITVARPPASVAAALRTACYDCHSNRTRYPWYASVQPAAWLLDHHVREGKRELNFSEFGAYPARRALHKLAAIGKEVSEGDMPLSSYTWMHPAARLTPEQRQKLVDWAQALHDKIPPE